RGDAGRERDVERRREHGIGLQRDRLVCVPRHALKPWVPSSSGSSSFRSRRSLVEGLCVFVRWSGGRMASATASPTPSWSGCAASRTASSGSVPSRFSRSRLSGICLTSLGRLLGGRLAALAAGGLLLRGRPALLRRAAGAGALAA